MFALAVHPWVVDMVLLVRPGGLVCIRSRCLPVWRYRETNDCRWCLKHNCETVSANTVWVQARLSQGCWTNHVFMASVFWRSLRFCCQKIELSTAVRHAPSGIWKHLHRRYDDTFFLEFRSSIWLRIQQDCYQWQFVQNSREKCLCCRCCLLFLRLEIRCHFTTSSNRNYSQVVLYCYSILYWSGQRHLCIINCSWFEPRKVLGCFWHWKLV